MAATMLVVFSDVATRAVGLCGQSVSSWLHIACAIYPRFIVSQARGAWGLSRELGPESLKVLGMGL
ncbi:hypothetical protein Taro_017954 [Colocasia esculenta]|uniref:Uncharacterized protein n=1 Tax=Colocasia esculenta TaxID=4460 RepID=A0A843USH7_COLES|nr:hypothetical protein [Colocasia esculenta]